MRISRAGILFLAVIVAISGAGCSAYNSVMARKNVVDGAEAFKGRKFAIAEELFRAAVNRAPDGSKEQKTAQLFLARTLHSEFAANRIQTDKATQAIEEYKKVLATDPADGSSFKAVANLYESLGQMDDWRKWITDRTNNTGIPPEQRAESYTSLGAKENTCANDITELPAVKKTVIKDNKASYTFSKPEKPEDLETLRGCIQKGTELIDKALALETDQVKNLKSINVKSLSDKELVTLNDVLKPFESARSYKTSLLVQSMRLAEMEGKTADKDKFKQESEVARESFKEIGDITKQISEEQDTRKKAEEAAASGQNANTNTSK